METSITKPPKYAYRKPLAEGIAMSATKRVQPQSLKNRYKNVKRSPV